MSVIYNSVAEISSYGIRADAVFFSARGICDNVITDSSKGERDIKVAMIENSKKHYFLCDTSKYGKESPYVVTNMENVDRVIDETCK